MSEDRIFISAGEASGDAYGAALILALRKIHPAIQVSGIGGARLAEASVNIIASSRSWGAISILESIKVVPKVVQGYLKAKKHLASGNPGLFIPIDYGFLNTKFLKFAKRKGWKTAYFIPPSSWKKGHAGVEVAKFSDAVIPPFEFNVEPYQKLGANVQYFGHPLLELRKGTRAGSTEKSHFIAAMPGSRSHELKEHLPLIAKIVPDEIAVHFILAPSCDPVQIETQWRKLTHNRVEDQFSVGNANEVLSQAAAGIICSGTATLEAAILGCPMIVIYKFPKSAEIEAKILSALGMFKRPTFISLPNILLGKEAVPEFVQENADPEKCRLALNRLLKDEAVCKTQCSRLAELVASLGNSDAITQSAIYLQRQFLT